jgi:RNA polymerase sigma-70 factor (ECF subfamily)
MAAVAGTEPSDETLVERARAGEAAAFASLYDRHMEAIYRYVYYRVPTRQDAEDITATVFARALHSLPHFRGQRCSFSTWLHRIAHNAVVDYHRAARGHTSLDAEPAQQLPGAEGADPAAGLEALDMRAVLARLPEEQRELLLLRFVDGLPHEQVATLLGKSVGACRALQHRALHALARLLGDQK